MRMSTKLLMILILINCAACSSVSGKIDPEKGPSMEVVYDSVPSGHFMKPQWVPVAERNIFHRLPNPELTLYMFPHVSGRDQVPVPGYYTCFNAYGQDHYGLPDELNGQRQ